MSEERKLFKNISFMALSMLVPSLLNLVLVMIVARILLNTGLNDYGSVVNYVTMFALLSDLGLSTVFVRDVARDHTKMGEYFGTLFVLRIFTSIVTISLALALVNFMPYDRAIINYIYVYAIAQLIFQFAQVFLSSFQAFEKMEYIAYGATLQTIALFVAGLYFVYSGKDVLGLIYANIIANIVLFAAYAFFMHRNISSIRFSFSAGKAKYLLLTGIPFGVYCLFNTLNVYLDKNLLSILDFKDIANYTQPYNLVMALSFIPLAFIASVFPLFSKLAITNNGSMKYACEKSFKYLITIMLPICVGTSLLADRIVFTMWGSTFSGAIPVLRILIWGLFFMTINAIGSTLVNATHKERANMVNIIFYTAVNAVLNIALIPVFGAVGSSVTFLITTGILNMAVTSYIARDSLKGINFVGPLVRSGVASVAMTAFILLVNVNNLFMYVILGAAVYFVAFALVGGVSRDDIELIERILFHKPNNPEDVKIEIL